MFNGLRKYILPLAFIYVISPIDLLPLFPADDLLVVALALLTYFTTSGKNITQHEPGKAQQDDDDVITTSWSVIEDE